MNYTINYTGDKMTDFEKIKTEIQSAIDEIREKEKYHASCIKENNKFVIMGLEIALDIIKRNEKTA